MTVKKTLQTTRLKVITPVSNERDTGRTILGLDIGARRIGLAVARQDIRIPQPLATLDASTSGTAVQQIARLATEHDAVAIVAGWPRGMAGQSTAQTKAVEVFVAQLRQELSVPVYLQDEALTSQKAEAELSARRKPFTKEDIDALAATYILEDYLRDHHANGPPSEAAHV